MIVGDGLDGDNRGIVLRDVSVPGGIILIGDWDLGYAAAVVESTDNKGGGGGIVLVSICSLLSLSDESDEPESLLLLSLLLEDDPELLEGIGLFPLAPIADGFLS